MKSQTRKTWITLLASCLLICAMTLVMFIANAPSQAKADGVTLGETKFSVSQDEDSIIFVTPIVADATEIAKIYEVGYTFDGEQPNVVNGQTNKYYTSLVTDGNALTAADIFGGTYEETTPMIIWEVERSDSTAYSATAYYKQGTVIEGKHYKDYNNVPDVAVNGTAKTTAVYEQIKSVDSDIETFLDGFNGVSLENYIAVSSRINEIDLLINDLTTQQKNALNNLENYNAVKSSYMIIDNVQGADIASRFTLSASTGINNGETLTTHASTLNHPIYGPCASIGKTNGQLVVKWNNLQNVDLSGYDRILVGVKNGTSDAQNWTSSGVALVKGVPANMSNTGEFITLVMSVDEFLSSGFATWQGSGSLWITSIIAIKGPVTNSGYYNMYSSALEGVELSDIKVLDDMRGKDIASRFTLSAASNGINNGETAPNVASGLFNDNYGRMSTVSHTNGKLTVKWNNVYNVDLSQYTHVLVAIKNNGSSAMNLFGKEVPLESYVTGLAAGAFTIIEIPMASFIEYGINTYNGGIWMGPIIAVKK